MTGGRGSGVMGAETAPIAAEPSAAGGSARARRRRSGLDHAGQAQAHSTVGDDDRRARLAWSMVAELGRPGPGVRLSEVQQGILSLGYLAAWHALVDGELGSGGAALALTGEVDVDAELARLARVGARTVVPGDPAWPDRLDGEDAPPLLHVIGRGDLAEVVARSAAVVGARASTGYGEAVALDLAAGLAGRGWSVVSGAAYGIDAAALRGGLAAGGRCVAVLPCGPDRVYPQGNRDLVRAVAEGGLVVTELPTGVVARRNRFLSRNRVIAGLARATCVVEAGLRSGSLNTAGWADHLGRPVAAVPGPVTSMSSAGCHELIRRGGHLVTDAAELCVVAAPMGEELDAAEDKRGPARPADVLGPVERRIHDALRGGRGRTVEEVAREALLTADEVLDHLALLEVKGWARRDDDGWRRGEGVRD